MLERRRQTRNKGVSKVWKERINEANSTRGQPPNKASEHETGVAILVLNGRKLLGQCFYFQPELLMLGKKKAYTISS